jgi:AhpC/TSA family
MVLNTTHAMGWKARDFALRGIDGRTYSLAEVRGPKGTLVAFICNHCPYVKTSISRIVAEANPGILGYALIKGVVAEIIDVDFFLEGSGCAA